jgi:hypothetical protein
MPPPFQDLTLDELASLLNAVRLRRRVTSIHLHHTWRPRHRDYRGHETIVGMWRVHTTGTPDRPAWPDLAQHVTVAPDGVLWIGRNWNLPPASAAGHNGTTAAGPFMIEMIGNFDHGEDPFEGVQRAVAIDALAHLVARFDLDVEHIRFHSELSSKTCPGTSIDRGSLLAEVARRRESLAATPRSTPRPAIFPANADLIYDVIERFARDPERTGEPVMALDREPGEEYADALLHAEAGERGGGGDEEMDLTGEEMDTLQPHVVNLSNGRFSTSGAYTTAATDVDAIFDEHLERALAAASLEGRPLRLVLFAHGGLVDERAGLRIALRHVEWWKRNRVYPLYFVWETGLIGALRSVIAGARDEEARGVLDGPIERALFATRLGARVWSSMKNNAARAVDEHGGGARYVSERLQQFVAAHQGRIQVHAVGHSAGANFHARFLPLAVRGGVAVETLHLLAPAISVADFHEQLAPSLGAGIGPLTIYTMRKVLELNDRCGPLYRKSLLYLIHFALEDERETDLLGLEVSLRRDPRLRQLFGLSGHPPAAGEVVWSTTTSSAGRSASRSTTHGGFDDDPATMESVLRRILGASDTAAIVPFPRVRAADPEGRAWDPPPGMPAGSALPGPISWRPSWTGSDEDEDSMPADGTKPSAKPASGDRKALCIGINRYRKQPLEGCVADARLWAATLRPLGFEVDLLLDAQATRAMMLERITALVHGSRPGDVVVIQYSGHGTTLPDRNQDEAGGDTPASDEAICPYDYTEGAFVIDDDLAAVYAGIPSGVNVTQFIDCCHSGTISRFGTGRPDPAGRGGALARYLEADEEMIQAHLAFRRRLHEGGRHGPRGPASMREILFSACRSTEVAWESDGQGDFTRIATRVLAGAQGASNEAFHRRVVSGFGSAPQQHPQLDCSASNRKAPLFGRTASRAAAEPTGLSAAAAGLPSNGRGDVAQIQRSLAELFCTPAQQP